jgi:hypothetical protein
MVYVLKQLFEFLKKNDYPRIKKIKSFIYELPLLRKYKDLGPTVLSFFENYDNLIESLELIELDKKVDKINDYKEKLTEANLKGKGAYGKVY